MSRDIKALCGLLDKERDCLLSGDLNGALGLARQKADLADRVEGQPNVARDAVETMRAKAERNVALLQAADDGLRSARARLRAIFMGVATQTYAADGTRTEIPVHRTGLERRA